MLTRLGFVGGVLALAATPPLAARAADPTPAPSALQMSLEAIVADFCVRAYAAGFPRTIAPPVVVLRSTPSLVSFTPSGILVSEWSALPPQVQGLFDSWATDAGAPWTGATLFDELFHWFFIPHELTHWLHTLGGTRPFTDRYGTEVEANRVAVAYWRRTDADQMRLAALAAALTAIRAKLPNPVPPGADPTQYFQTNYDALGSDPLAYGWYQLGMIIDAYRTANDAPTFNAMLLAIVARG